MKVTIELSNVQTVAELMRFLESAKATAVVVHSGKETGNLIEGTGTIVNRGQRVGTILITRE